MAFARNAFAAGGSTSWADDDDFDATPIPLAAPTLPKVEEQEAPTVRSPRGDRRHPSDDTTRGGDHHQQHRRGPHEQRRDYGDRDRGYNDRPRGNEYGSHHHHSRQYEHEPREQRPKNHVPDVAPFKIYFGNLPFHVTEDVIAHFIGDVDTIESIFMPFDRANDRIKGFAYVEFRTREALVQALTLDGKDLDGRAVNIDVATERKPRANDGFFEKRPHARGYERDGVSREPHAPKERPRLAIKPRSTSTDKNEGGGEAVPTTKPNPFGAAKPRDENVYLERRKSKELEEAAVAKPVKVERVTSAGARDRKPSQDGESGEGGGRGGRGRGGRATDGGRGGRATDGGRWERDTQDGGRGGRGGRNVPAPEGEVAPADEEREVASGRGGRGGHERGRGRGQEGGRGGRGQEGGRGRGRGAGRGGRTSEAPAPPSAPTPTKKEIKQREPPKVNLKLAGTTTKNLFASLNDDSDSD